MNVQRRIFDRAPFRQRDIGPFAAERRIDLAQAHGRAELIPQVQTRRGYWWPSKRRPSRPVSSI
jgi:hypothetical protein